MEVKKLGLSTVQSRWPVDIGGFHFNAPTLRPHNYLVFTKMLSPRILLQEGLSTFMVLSQKLSYQA
jgi:hypothetical protein